MKFACFWLLGAIVGYALEGTIAAALITGTIAFYLRLALASLEQEGE